MKISADIDTSKLKGLTQGQLAKQIPFIIARSLTAMAFKGRAAGQEDAKRNLKLTKKFIPNSIVVRRAEKRDRRPFAQVGYLERVSLIGLMEDGGIRRPEKGKTLAVPTLKLKPTGKRITKSKRPETLLKKDNVFSGVIGGVRGIWRKNKRGKTKFTLLYAYEDQAKYESDKIHFRDSVRKAAEKSLISSFQNSLDNAIRTMR